MLLVINFWRRSLEIFAPTRERVLLSSFFAILTNYRYIIALASCLQPFKLFQPFVYKLLCLPPFSWFIVATWPIKRRAITGGSSFKFPGCVNRLQSPLCSLIQYGRHDVKPLSFVRKCSLQQQSLFNIQSKRSKSTSCVLGRIKF